MQGRASVLRWPGQALLTYEVTMAQLWGNLSTNVAILLVSCMCPLPVHGAPRPVQFRPGCAQRTIPLPPAREARGPGKAPSCPAPHRSPVRAVPPWAGNRRLADGAVRVQDLGCPIR